MLFHSLGFFIFFWIVFSVYWGFREHNHRMLWLLVASIIFYATWNVWFLGLIVFTAGVDYYIALRIEAAQSLRVRRLWLLLSLGMSLSLLGFFKYTLFLLGASCDLLGLFGIHRTPPAWNIMLPLGISFYTFETISYIVDVYRGRVKAERNVLRYALYIMFFPHLIAGPIVRPAMFLAQIPRLKRFDWLRMNLGVRLFLGGLLKKAVFADRLAAVIDPVFQHPGAYDTGSVWLAAVGYAMQVYCDFSGYTDMALGAAHALGFKLPQNFDRPYIADSVGDIWRRWHMSLSQWLRDYLFIPLGGSRGGTWRTCRNLIVTMTIAGIWHGAGWAYPIFGLLHGLAMSIERVVPSPAFMRHRFARPLRIARTFLFWVLSLVIFRNPTLASAGEMFGRMFHPLAGITIPHNALLMAWSIVALVLLGQFAGGAECWRRLASRIPAPAAGIAMACLFVIIQLFIPDDANPFIYFRF